MARRFGLVSELWAALRRPVPPAQQGHLVFGWVFLLLMLIQGGTGVLLSIYYQPSPAAAAESLAHVMRDVHWGWLVRGLHEWTAVGLLVAVVTHLLRMFVLGRYRRERAAHWVLGLILFAMVVLFLLTGEMLPWDDDGYWAAAAWLHTVHTIPGVGGGVAAALRGGPDVGPATLARAHTMHVLLLPWISFYVLLLNFWLMTRRWRREGEVA